MKKLLQLCSVLMLGLLFLAGNAQAQTYYVDANTGSDANPCSSLLPCSTLGHVIANYANGTEVVITGTTSESGTVTIPVAWNGVTIRGVVTDPGDANFAGISTTAVGNVLRIDGLNVTIRNLAIFRDNNDWNVTVRVFGDNATFDNVTFESKQPDTSVLLYKWDNINNLQVLNSRFIGTVGYFAVQLVGGEGHVIRNNRFSYTQKSYVGNSLPGGALFFDPTSSNMGATVEFNIFDFSVEDGGEADLIAAIYMYANWPLTAPNSVVVRHNTIAIDGANYSLGTVNGIYIDIDNDEPADVAQLVNSISSGEIVVTNNVITGAVDNNAGVGYGLHVPIAFGPTFASYNLFWNNEDDSNNAIDTATGAGNGNNISEDVSGAAADPNFDGTDDYGYDAPSPAIGSSSTGLNSSPNPFPAPFDAISPNRGYNQISNTNAPVISALTATGTPSLPVVADEFLATEDITVSWAFSDLDLPQDASQTNFRLRVENTTGAVAVVTPELPAPYFDGIVDGPNLGSSLTFIIPAGTLAQGEEYEVFVEVFDSIGLSDSDSHIFTTAANSAPTASAFKVEGSPANLNVNTTNPTYSFVYDDIDGDNMASVTVNVYRVSANCGMGPNCAPLVPTTDPNVTAANSLLIGSKTLTVGALPTDYFAGPIEPTDLVEFDHYALSDIIGPILANEDYEWTVELTDAAASTSPVYGTSGPLADPTLIFSTVDITAAGLSNLRVDGLDNTEVRVIDGLLLPTPPTFSWMYTGAIDDMQSFDVRITRTGAGVTEILPLTNYPASAASTTPGTNMYTLVDPSGVNLAPNRIYTFEIRVKSFLGAVSDWQQIQYTRNQAPTASAMLADAAVLSAGPLQFSANNTPLFAWTFTDANTLLAPNHEGQTAFELEIYLDSFNSTVVYNSGKVSSPLSVHQLGDFELMYDQTYFVGLKVWDVNDTPNGADFIDMGGFRTPVNVPAQILSVSMDGASNVPDASPYFLVDSQTPTFEWVYFDPQDDIVNVPPLRVRPQFSYELELFDGAMATLGVRAKELGAADTYVFDGADFAGLTGGLLVPGQTYTLRVLAYQTTSDGTDVAVEGGAAVGERDFTFTYVTTPSAPVALSIDDARFNGTINSLTPTFNFTPDDADGEAAVTYRVQVQDGTNTNVGAPYDAPADSYANGAPISVALASMYLGLDLDANANYRWRVRTTDPHGNGAWSAWQDFAVDPVPGAPTALTVNGFGTGDAGLLNLPTGTPNATLTLGWTDNDHGDPAAGHSIRIFETAVPANVVHEELNGVGGSPQVVTTDLPLVPGTTYTWELRTSDASGMGNLPAEYSPLASLDFRISDRPVAIDLKVDGELNNPGVQNLYPTMSWTFTDPDLGDTQSGFEIVVTRTSSNCGACNAGPFTVWNSGFISSGAASVPFGNNTPGDIIEGLLPNESYSWTLVVYDSNGIASDPPATGTFTTVSNMATDITLFMDGQEYLAGGTAGTRFNAAPLNIEDGSPSFSWSVSGLLQSQFYIEVNTSPTFTGTTLWSTGNCLATANPVVYGADLGALCSNVPGGAVTPAAALTDGVTYYVRVNVGSGVSQTDFAYAKFELNKAPTAITGFEVDSDPIDDNVNPPFATAQSRTPVFSWDFNDPNLASSSDGQSAFKLEISTTVPFGTPTWVFDSDDDLTYGPIDGTQTSFQIPADILAFTTNYAVRLTVKDRYGVESPQIIGIFAVVANTPPTFTAVQAEDGTPAPDQTQILTRTPHFSWSGYNDSDTPMDPQGFSRVIVRDAGSTVVYDSGAEANTAASHTFDPSNCVTGGCPEFVWGASYQVEVRLWDDRYDPVNFPGDPYASVVHDYTVSVYNRTPDALVINPAVVYQNGSSVATATLSTPGAWATLLVSNGMTESFFGTEQDDDFDGEVTFNLDSANPTGTAGDYTFRLFETPVAVANPGDLGSLIGASFETATLEVIPGALVIGDVNMNGSIWTVPPPNPNPIYDQGDIVLTLRYTAGLVELTSEQMLRANVDNSADIFEPGDRVNVGDILDMQERSLGLIDCFAHPLDAGNCPQPKVAGGEVVRTEYGRGAFALASGAADPASGLVELPVVVRGDGVKGFQISIDYGQSGVSVHEVLLNDGGWMQMSSDRDGVLRITGVTAEAVSELTVATVVFSLNGNAQPKVTVTGMVNKTAMEAQSLDLVALPDEYALGQNYPNPFNPSTQIRFSLPEAQSVVLEVYNVAGQKVATLVDRNMNAGEHVVSFNAANLSSGVYIYRIHAGSFRAIQKMTLIK